MFRMLYTAGVALAVVVGSPILSPGGLTQIFTSSAEPQDPKKDEPKKDEPKKDEPKKDEPKKDEPKKDEPKKDEPKKDEPKKDEPKKDEPKKPADEKKADVPVPPSAPAKKASTKNSKIKPYDEIVTVDFKTSPGLFFVHKSDERILYEIPTDVLGKEMIWVRHIEKATTGVNNGFPMPERVVRWEQRGDDVLLRDVKYDIRADTKDPIKNAVEAHSLEPIIAVLGVKAYGKDKAPVIDVTELFTTDMPEFSVAQAVGGAGADPRKTFVESVKAFPENIETKVLLTYRRMGGGGGRPGMGGGGGGGAITLLLHHSMVKLPEEPMKPRRFDERVGFFTEDFEDYGNVTNHQVENVKYITRWRLEKKDPNAEVSEPKKPIVFYIGREVPDKLRPFIKKGVEAWQPAFEKAGFKNAILCKDAPTPRENADWDPEDARYSTIRWLPSTVENAMGPNVHDPRTGEILESDIIMWHNILKLARDWFFVQASPNEPKAQKLPLPDDLVGDLICYVVSHEVGHTLGLRHNMKASSSFTVAQLRDPKFTAENGTEASIMDYGRFNYVAQPGDGAALIPKIGPYDRFAIEWGYKSFAGANSYDAEKAKLEEIVARQIKDGTVRFGGGMEDGADDPSERSEDLGDDAIAATELGLKNIDRVAGYLVKATSKKGEDYAQLRNMYTQLIGQRGRELSHVANLVGGNVKTNIFFGDADSRFAPIPGDQQRKAVAFLIANAFATPKALIAPDITARLEANGAVDRILNSQRGILRALVNEAKVRKLAEQVSAKPEGAYTPIDLLTDLHRGIYGDIKADVPDLDVYRRNLIRAYTDTLIGEVVKENASSDLPALARGELKGLLAEIDASKDKKVAPATRMFLDDLRHRVAQSLEPKTFIQGGSAPQNPGLIIFGGDAEAPEVRF